MDITELCEEYQEEVKSYLSFKLPEHSENDIDTMAHCITHIFINALNYVLSDLVGGGE